MNTQRPALAPSETVERSDPRAIAREVGALLSRVSRMLAPKRSPAVRDRQELARLLAKTSTLMIGWADYGTWPSSDQSAELTSLRRERRLLAMLASETPQFDNPLVAWEAQAVRDRILAEGAIR